MTNLRSLLENNDFYRIPLKKLATGHYKLTAKINGVKGEFILDTGASNSCIDLIYVTRFNLKSEDSKLRASGAGAVNMETKLARKNTLSLGAWHSNQVDFVLFDMSHVNEALFQMKEKAVAGIIGADFLIQRRGVIDYGRNCMYFK